MEIHIKFKHVVPCQLLDALFVPFDLIVDPLDFRPSPPVQALPELLNLVDQELVRLMRRLMCMLLACKRHEMLERSFGARVGDFATHIDESGLLEGVRATITAC